MFLILKIKPRFILKSYHMFSEVIMIWFNAFRLLSQIWTVYLSRRVLVYKSAYPCQPLNRWHSCALLQDNYRNIRLSQRLLSVVWQPTYRPPIVIEVYISIYILYDLTYYATITNFHGRDIQQFVLLLAPYYPCFLDNCGLLALGLPSIIRDFALLCLKYTKGSLLSLR